VCKCVLPPGDNPIAVNKYIIYYIILIPVDDGDDNAQDILIFVSFPIHSRHFLDLSASPKNLSKNPMQTMDHLS
jgi:hypothetical protein